MNEKEFKEINKNYHNEEILKEALKNRKLFEENGDEENLFLYKFYSLSYNTMYGRLLKEKDI